MCFTPTAIGRTYSESTTMIAREDRSADGTLRRDLTASKKTFTLAYDAIDNSELALWENLYNNYAGLELSLTVRYTGDFTSNGYRDMTYTVLIRAFSKQRLLAVRGGLWENVTIEFEEV
jgi:hypothetical protein